LIQKPSETTHKYCFQHKRHKKQSIKNKFVQECELIG
jgi:hypothetical protein